MTPAAIVLITAAFAVLVAAVIVLSDRVDYWCDRALHAEQNADGERALVDGLIDRSRAQVVQQDITDQLLAKATLNAERWAAALVDHVNPTAPVGAPAFLHTPTEQSRELSREARNWLSERGTSARDVLDSLAGREHAAWPGPVPKV